VKKGVVFITLALQLIFAWALVDSFDSVCILLFAGLAFFQFCYFDHRAAKLTTYMFVLWIFTYYIPVTEMGMYYTSEQVFTDSNFYDFYALRFSDYSFKEIIKLSDVTWQSTFVVSFYAFIYKIFGKILLVPVIINLYLVYLSLYLIKIKSITKNIHIWLVYLMSIFASTIYIMPGKDILTTLFLAILMSLSFSKYTIIRQSIVTLFCFSASLFNRLNSLPLLFFLELRRIRKIFSIKHLIPMGALSLILFFVIESELSFYLDIQTMVDRQRENTQFSKALVDVLLPRNMGLYFLVTPLRFIAYLISPFPFYNKLFETYWNVNTYFFYFQLGKFISGGCWVYIIGELTFTYKRYNKRLVFILLMIPLMISTVQLLQGGRYRVVCDLFYFWVLTTYYQKKRLY